MALLNPPHAHSLSHTHAHARVVHGILPPLPPQVYQYYVSQNNQYVALDSAPKYVLLPGFSCTIAAVVFMTLGLLVDVLTAWSSRAPVVTGSPSAPTLRSSPTHVSHYHVTSPLSLAAGRSSNMLTDQL
jgi:hypothetical protein